MIDISNRFKLWLKTKETPPLGTWLMAASPSIAEALGHTGFDFLVIDMEHSPLDLAAMESMLRAVGCTQSEAIVRLPSKDTTLIKRALDAGASTLMIPFVQSAEEAQLLVSYTRYPPGGMRGVAAIHRASRFGRAENYLKRADDEVCVVVQLETPEAIAQLSEIAAIPGIDALFVGPGDLSGALGYIGNIGHREVQALIHKAAQDAKRAGKPIGIVGPNPDMVKTFLGYGYNFVAVGSDIAMMTTRSVDYLQAIRDVNHPTEIAEAAY